MCDIVNYCNGSYSRDEYFRNDDFGEHSRFYFHEYLLASYNITL